MGGVLTQKADGFALSSRFLPGRLARWRLERVARDALSSPVEANSSRGGNNSRTSALITETLVRPFLVWPSCLRTYDRTRHDLYERCEP